MKKYYIQITLCLFAWLSISLAQAQCVPNTSFTSPGIYPDTLPTATVGQSYSQDITFVMPLDTQGVDFTNFKIVSVALPVGLNWVCNNVSNECNYNPQVNQYGCVNVYGTPLLAGIYNVAVTAVADLTIIQGVPVTFDVYMEVLPAEVNTTNDGFSMSGFSGCSPITVEFTNNNPGLVAYSWDFGNGNISTAENPSPQVYTAPGNYPVTYQAWESTETIYVYTLTNVRINSMSGYGEGFPSYEAADAYYKIFENGVLFAQSSIIMDTNPPVEWATSMILDPSKTYTIEIWEADESASEILFGADDYMGVHTMMMSGCNGCAAGSANINYTINMQTILPTPAVVTVDTVRVYGYPAVPSISYDDVNYVLSTTMTDNSVQWYMNGSPISAATGLTHTVSESGDYSLVAINEAGCISFSDTISVVYCDPTFVPSISNNGGQLTVSNPGGYDVQWYFNGNPISGAFGNTYTPSQGGSYHAELSNNVGCTYESAPFTSTVGIDAISLQHKISMYPNPTNGQFFIKTPADFDAYSLEIFDFSGRVVYEKQLSNSELHEISINVEAGAYLVNIKSGNEVYTFRLIVK
jgi:PKD repeat protein